MSEWVCQYGGKRSAGDEDVWGFLGDGGGVYGVVPLGVRFFID